MIPSLDLTEECCCCCDVGRHLRGRRARARRQRRGPVSRAEAEEIAEEYFKLKSSKGRG